MGLQLKRDRKFKGVVAITCVLVASAIIGLLFLIAGLKLSEPWWDSKSFLVNIVSTFTGALFGIPFAVAILYRLSQYQANQDQRRTTLRLAHRGIAELITTADSILSCLADPTLLEEINSLLLMAESQWSDFMSYTMANTILSPAARPPVPERDSYDFRARARLLSDILFRIQGRINILVRNERLQADMVEIYAHKWNYLDSYLRPRILDASLPWLADEIYVQMKNIRTTNDSLIDIKNNEQLENMGRWLENWRHEKVLKMFSPAGEPYSDSQLTFAITDIRGLLAVWRTKKYLTDFAVKLR